MAVAASRGDVVAAVSDESVLFTADAAFDNTHTTAKKAPLSYANHPAVPNPMTNVQFDNVMKAASLHLGRADFSADVACCAGMQRTGNAGVVGTLTDGLDSIDNEAEFYAVVNSTAARGKVVRLINYCGGPGTNILGCSWVAGNGMVLVRFGNVADEGVLWAHEYGHNAGLSHNPIAPTSCTPASAAARWASRRRSAASTGRPPPAPRSRRSPSEPAPTTIPTRCRT